MPEPDLQPHSFGHPEDEPDQTAAALWGMRVFVLLITLMVIYTFFAAPPSP